MYERSRRTTDLGVHLGERARDGHEEPRVVAVTGRAVHAPAARGREIHAHQQPLDDVLVGDVDVLVEQPAGAPAYRTRRLGRARREWRQWQREADGRAARTARARAGRCAAAGAPRMAALAAALGRARGAAAVGRRKREPRVAAHRAERGRRERDEEVVEPREEREVQTRRDRTSGLGVSEQRPRTQLSLTEGRFTRRRDDPEARQGWAPEVLARIYLALYCPRYERVTAAMAEAVFIARQVERARHASDRRARRRAADAAVRRAARAARDVRLACVLALEVGRAAAYHAGVATVARARHHLSAWHHKYGMGCRVYEVWWGIKDVRLVATRGAGGCACVYVRVRARMTQSRAHVTMHHMASGQGGWRATHAASAARERRCAAAAAAARRRRRRRGPRRRGRRRRAARSRRGDVRTDSFGRQAVRGVEEALAELEAREHAALARGGRSLAEIERDAAVRTKGGRRGDREGTAGYKAYDEQGDPRAVPFRRRSRKRRTAVPPPRGDDLRRRLAATPNATRNDLFFTSSLSLYPMTRLHAVWNST